MFQQIKKRIKTLSVFEIFISFSVIILVVFVIKFFGLKAEWKTIRVEVINKSWSENYNPYGYRTPFWLSSNLKVGQKEYSKSGVVIAEIIDIENYERGGEEAEVYLTVKIRSTLQKRIHQYFFKNKPLNLGAAIELLPDQNIVYGQIVDIDVPEGGYPKKTLIVTASGHAWPNEFVDQVRDSKDTMNNRYTQTPIATILSFQAKKPTRLYIKEEEGGLSPEFGLKTNQESKDVLMKLKINVDSIDNRWYFGGHQQIKIGNFLYFYGQKVNFILVIENVEEQV